MKKLLKKNSGLIITLFISTVITFFYLIPSYGADGYCSNYYSYGNYALIFVQSGRFIPALAYYIIEKLNISPNIISIISVILSNIFLSIGVNLIYKKMSDLVETTIINRIIIYIGAFLICFNPFMLESYAFEESFCLTLGFLLSICAGNIVFSNKDKKYFKAFILLFIACICYQGMLCIFMPYILCLSIVNNYKTNIFDTFKKDWKIYLYAFLSYFLSLVLSFILLKSVIMLFDLSSEKFGELNIFSNILSIFRILIYIIPRLYKFTNPIIFYLFGIFFLTLMLCPTLSDKKNQLKKYFSILLLLITCVAFAFVPNLAMDSSNNYSAPRMINSIGATMGFLIILSTIFQYKNPNTSKYYKIVILVLSLAFILYDARTYLKNSYYFLQRYYNDVSFATEIYDIIDEYEDVNDIEVDEIIYYIGKNTPWYYDGIVNGNNIRFYAIPWAFECGINAFSSKHYKMTMLSNQNNEYDVVYSKIFKYKFDNEKFYIFIGED